MSLQEKLSASQNQSDENNLAIEQFTLGLTEGTQQIEKHLQNTEEEQEKCRQQEMSNLMAITCSMESNIIEQEPDGTYSTQPHEAFYFCSKNALTIGYGIKIEYKNGRLCPEGEEILKRLDLKRNNESLTMDEKRTLVKNCFTRRDERDKNAKNPKKSDPILKNSEGKIIPKTAETCELRPISQKVILFNDNDYASIDKDNALEVTRYEYEKKLNTLLGKKPFLGNSYFLKAFSADVAFQNGDSGVRKFDFYRNASNKILKSEYYPVERPLKGKSDRYKMRSLLFEMAYKTHNASKSRKGKPATPASQTKFIIEALKEFNVEFKDGIMKREKQKIVLMEQFMTVTMMQCYRNVKGADLTLDEIKKAEKDAHNLVYDQLFHSKLIQQLPEKIRPTVLVNGIKNLDTKDIGKPGKNICSSLQASISKEAQQKLEKYIQKNKIDKETYPLNPLQMQAQNGRW